ncbi:MAG: tripartite tricarboxylate transporter permease, partial [Desulfobacterales bacterium]
MFEAAFSGLEHVFEISNFLFLFAGVFMGIVFGALPGLTATMGLALLVPFTFTMHPAAGLIMLAGIYVGAMYGDAIPAILINTPGTPAAIATTFDGFPLARKGMAQHGLVAAAVSSSFGSLVANIVLATAAPPLAEASLKFGPPEYFWLGVFGLTIIATLSSGSIFKGLLAGTIGLLLSCIGMAPIGGDVRLTFGFPELQAGIDLIVALIGFFCLPEILEGVIGQRRAKYTEKTANPRFAVVWEVVVALFRRPALMLRSSIIGTIIGFAPGAGGNIASMVSYNEACRWDKHPEEFGKGTIKGVAASEAANSAMAPGSLIPLLTLGIPGSPPAAVILGALMLHGMRPGMELFTTHADITYAFIMGLLVAAFLVTIIGSFGSFFFARIINIPSRYLAPAIIFMTVL